MRTIPEMIRAIVATVRRSGEITELCAVEIVCAGSDPSDAERAIAAAIDSGALVSTIIDGRGAIPGSAGRTHAGLCLPR